MTIEESICELKYVRKLNERILEDRSKEKDVDNTWIKHWENVVESLNMAIEIMRKYQKIKHIINDVPYLDKDEYKIASIKEIIDGND